jgi:hypothetical protein
MRVRGLILILLAGAFLGACSDPPPATTGQTNAPALPDDPRTILAARAAAAQDLQQVASYRLHAQDRPDRTVTFTQAKDGGWRLDVPGQALGGAVDIALVKTAAGMFQCALPDAGCVRVSHVSASFDPKLEHVFTDWLAVFTDPDAALAVSAATPLPDTPGTCFAVDTSSVSVKAPLDAGIYCYADNGTLTGARTSVGTLSLMGTPTAGPPSVTLPGAIKDGAPLPNASPPAPSPTVSVSGSAKPSPSVTSTTSAR